MAKIYQFPPRGIYADTGLAAALWRPGFILVGFSVKYAPYLVVADWMTESGSRQLLTNSTNSPAGVTKIEPYYRYSRRKFQKSRENGDGYYDISVCLAPSLLEDGPDRRREYLKARGPEKAARCPTA